MDKKKNSKPLLNDLTVSRDSMLNHDKHEQKAYPVKINEDNLVNDVIETNRISTSKYRWYNCIPKILVEQFSKMANIYFLLIAFMQSINDISISGGKPVILFPLSVVTLLNGLKDFFEDWKRKKSDDEENYRKCRILNYHTGQFEEKHWEDIKLGHIIKVEENEYFPADLVLINSQKTASKEEDSEGICYIETKNLDGETNLKYKQAVKELTSYKEEKQLAKIKGLLECSQPNEFIYEFNAKLYCDKMINIDKQSFLLRGCSLRQTHCIFGIAVYVGHNTKIMKNSPSARTKTSRIENIMNTQIIVIVIVQFTMSFIGALLYLYWITRHKHELTYVLTEAYLAKIGFVFFLFRIGTWNLIFTNLVPISLLVTLEMIKYIQGMFISWDIRIIDTITFTPSKVQTSTLNEELGQVKFIFSDKTGTLTKNYMEFKKISVGKYIYTQESNLSEAELKDKIGKITNFNFHDEEFISHLNNINHENYKNIHHYLLCLALCHTAFTEEKGDEIIYQASSPDEMALISAARYYKYIFIKREVGNKMIIEIKGKKYEYNISHILEYTSERKRMSVIVHCPDGKIRVYSKGADSIIKERIGLNLDQIEITDGHLHQFAKKGLRTLAVAYREVSLEEYTKFEDEYNKAVDHYDKDNLMPKVFNLIENNFYLLGATAIDDKLQDNVGACLESFIKTGIKVWVLTGDKVDTAKSIAFSCKLLTHEFIILEYPEKATNEELKMITDEFLRKVNSKEKENRKFCLVMASDEIAKMMQSKKLTNKLYELSIKCNSVLCCRVSPKQKAEMVQLIKVRQPDTTTLAIGDGANDVNMITSAHIGVGILGVEGRQAARASDYSIAQFSFLKRLIYVHGRESYRKNSYVVCYNFYKNVLFVMPQFWFGFVSYFSGQTLYDPWIYQFFNIFFSATPIIWFGIYDKEVSYDTLEVDSRYYIQGIIGKLFHSTRFWKWVGYGMIQGYLIFLFSFYSNNSIVDLSGMYQDLWSCGSMAYSSIVLIVNIRILISTCTHSVISFGLFFGSVIVYYIILYLMSIYYKFENFNNFTMIFNSYNFYLSTIILIFCCIILDIGVGKILLLYGLVQDPLSLTAEDTELKKYEMQVIEDENAINNAYTGAAFSQEQGQLHLVPRRSITTKSKN